MTRAAVFVAALSCAAAGSAAGQQSVVERAYLRAVAGYFQMPEGEISILSQWSLPADEIPVVLFVARRAGVSAEALVALRESGRAWTTLTASYDIGASALHVPLSDPEAAGALSPAYERFRDTPVAQWASVPLSEQEIVSLVNVRVLSQALGVSPDEVARQTGTTPTFVELYGRLLQR